MHSPWYKNAIFYELYVRAFKDSNNDGNGDFTGLISKLDYLKELGIDCVWILPMYPSPGKDDGYDIMDYYSINPDYGTILDFKEFLDEAHSRNIKVITDLVLNHTSDRNPWFLEASKGPESSYFNYYVWSENTQKYKDVRIIFNDAEKSNWTFNEQCGKYYWHRFYHHQPDLNFDNPEVRKEMLKIIKFWLDMGVDGFRMDAVPYLFEREGTSCESLPETHQYLKEIREFVDSNYSEKLLLAEANQWPKEMVKYFGNDDEFNMVFNFPLMPRLFMALKKEDSGSIIEILKSIPDFPEDCQWCIFLRNHDELTLEMVSDEEKIFMYSKYASNKKMIINTGIRRRLAPLLENDRRKIELLNVLLFTLPGSPIIYYGDEIGMGDDISLFDRNGVRTPIQWNSSHNAGFSDCIQEKLYARPITGNEFDYRAVNIELQQKNETSLLNWMKKIIAMRKQYQVFGNGNINFIECENKSILAFKRKFDEEFFLCVFNLSSEFQPAVLNLEENTGYIPREVFSGREFPAISNREYFLSMGQNGYFIFELTK